MRIGEKKDVQALDSYTKECLIKSCKPYGIDPSTIKVVRFDGYFLGMFKMFSIPDIETSFIVR